jgi:acetyl-CoA C-acetyltransferase
LTKGAIPLSNVKQIDHSIMPAPSGIVDGAGAVLLASPEYARSHGMKPRSHRRDRNCWR